MSRPKFTTVGFMVFFNDEVVTEWPQTLDEFETSPSGVFSCANYKKIEESPVLFDSRAQAREFIKATRHHCKLWHRDCECSTQLKIYPVRRIVKDTE